MKSAFHNTLKRLEIIRSLILLEEYIDIPSHIDKLIKDRVDSNNQLSEIISALQKEDYTSAISQIQEYLQNAQSLVEYEDPEVEALKIEIRKLEAELNALTNEKANIEKTIHDFNIRYHRELGDLISEILKIKKEKLREKAKKDKRFKSEHKDAENDYERFHKQNQETKKKRLVYLSAEQREELKRMFRRASKFCHPDVVADELKEKLTRLFVRLKNAYDESDIEEVGRILHQVDGRNGVMMKIESLTETDKLRTYAQTLRKSITELRDEVEQLKTSDTYQIITSITDMDEYFSEKKVRLEAELQALKV